MWPRRSAKSSDESDNRSLSSPPRSNPAGDSLPAELLKQSPGCHWIVDSRLVFVRLYGNPRPIFGKVAEELVGRAPAEVLAPEAAALWDGRFARVLDGAALTLRERPGETVWNVSMFPVRDGNDARYAGGTATEAGLWAEAEQSLRYTVLGALKTQQFERTMVSRFLHDSVGQNLTAFGLQLDLIRMDLEAASPEQCARIVEVQKLLEEMMEKVRGYSYELNPATVERAGLRTALDLLVARIRERFAGALRLNVDPSLKIDKGVASAHVSHRQGGRRERRAARQLLGHRNRGKVLTYWYRSRSEGQWEGIRPGGCGGRVPRTGFIEYGALRGGSGFGSFGCESLRKGNDRTCRRSGGRLNNNYAIRHCSCR